MPTDTDPNLRSVDSPTAAISAVTPPVFPADPARHDPVGVIAEEPDLPVDLPVDPAVLSTAEWLHFMNCDCGDVDNHAEHDGWDFHALAAAWEARAVADAIRAGVVTAGRAPVETKVQEAALGTLAATMGLTLVTLLLDRLDVIPSLLGGQHPWAGPLVLVLGVILPPAASFLRGYLAAHSPRAAR